MSTAGLSDARRTEVDTAITELIAGDQFSSKQADKDHDLLAILRPLCEQMAEACPPYARFLARLGGSPAVWTRVADVPPLPVTMFKRFALSAVAPERVVRELHSSSTTGQSPSRIFIDKTTAFRQSRALVSILKDALGGKRRPYLVVDAEEAAAAGDVLTARGAAIRGIGSFANSTTYALRSRDHGDLMPDWDAIEAFFERHGDEPILIFGFTFIVWSRFVRAAEARGARFDAPEASFGPGSSARRRRAARASMLPKPCYCTLGAGRSSRPTRYRRLSSTSASATCWEWIPARCLISTAWLSR